MAINKRDYIFHQSWRYTRLSFFPSSFLHHSTLSSIAQSPLGITISFCCREMMTCSRVRSAQQVWWLLRTPGTLGQGMSLTIPTKGWVWRPYLILIFHSLFLFKKNAWIKLSWCLPVWAASYCYHNHVLNVFSFSLRGQDQFLTNIETSQRDGQISCTYVRRFTAR